MTAILIALNIIAGLFLVAVVLLQAGKGRRHGRSLRRREPRRVRTDGPGQRAAEGHRRHGGRLHGQLARAGGDLGTPRIGVRRNHRTGADLGTGRTAGSRRHRCSHAPECRPTAAAVDASSSAGGVEPAEAATRFRRRSLKPRRVAPAEIPPAAVPVPVTPPPAAARPRRLQHPALSSPGGFVLI